jgi:hypothetical protein
MLFHPGRIVGTPAALALDKGGIMRCLDRHLAGEWGDLDAHDARMNDDALAARDGSRLMSVYTVDGTRVYVITDAPFTPHTVTTVLLPSEY